MFREILCTLGPVSYNERVIVRLADLGVSLFRINLSHTTYDELCMVGVEFVGTPTEITAGVNKGGFATYFKGVDRIRFELFQKPKPAV